MNYFEIAWLSGWLVTAALRFERCCSDLTGPRFYIGVPLLCVTLTLLWPLAMAAHFDGK